MTRGKKERRFDALKIAKEDLRFSRSADFLSVKGPGAETLSPGQMLEFASNMVPMLIVESIPKSAWKDVGRKKGLKGLDKEVAILRVKSALMGVVKGTISHAADLVKNAKQKRGPSNGKEEKTTDAKRVP